MSNKNFKLPNEIEELEEDEENLSPAELFARAKAGNRTSSIPIKTRIKEFSALMDSIDASLDKKKILWKEIYENAITDRQNSYCIFTDLFTKTIGKSAEHAIHGQTLSKYLERMSKSTDQLIKLAEIIATAEMANKEKNPNDEDDDDSPLDNNEIYAQIGNNKRNARH